MTQYLSLYRQAYLATTREEAHKILKEAQKLELLDDIYKSHFMFLTTKWN